MFCLISAVLWVSSHLRYGNETLWYTTQHHEVPRWYCVITMEHWCVLTGAVQGHNIELLYTGITQYGMGSHNAILWCQWCLTSHTNTVKYRHTPLWCHNAVLSHHNRPQWWCQGSCHDNIKHGDDTMEFVTYQGSIVTHKWSIGYHTVALWYHSRELWYQNARRWCHYEVLFCHYGIL